MGVKWRYSYRILDTITVYFVGSAMHVKVGGLAKLPYRSQQALTKQTVCCFKQDYDDLSVRS